MKIGDRGPVTIPEEIRGQFGLGPETEVELRVVGGSIILKKSLRKLDLAKCAGSFCRVYSSVDEFCRRHSRSMGKSTFWRAAWTKSGSFCMTAVG